MVDSCRGESLGEKLEKIVPVLHNVYSPQKVLEAARTTYGLGYKLFVVTKASGSAAQAGVPEAQKMALRLGKGFLYLASIDDVLEIFRPELVLTVAPPPYAEKPLNVEDVTLSSAKDYVVVVFGGSEPGLSRRELEKGVSVYPPGLPGDIGSIGLLAITLYLIKQALDDPHSG